MSAPNLPVMQPTKFELVLNLQTARLLGITVLNGPCRRIGSVLGENGDGQVNGAPGVPPNVLTPTVLSIP